MKLWCYNHRRPTEVYFEIDVPPSMTVFGCKTTLLRVLDLHSVDADLISLYKIPEAHPVPFKNIESTLGALSVSGLGKALPPHMTMQQCFAHSPEEHLHLVVVDRGTSLPVNFWIPSTQKLLTVDVANRQTVTYFLPAIEAQDPTFKGGDLVFYKTPYSFQKPQELYGTLPKDHPLDPVSNLYMAFDDVPFSKLACITVEAVRPARKHALSTRNTEECRKRQALTHVSPSQVDTSHTLAVQSKEDQRVYDYRMSPNQVGPLPESDLPPIEVLFDGFGRFLEIWRAASATDFNPDQNLHLDPLDADNLDPLYIRIEKFVATMSQRYSDENMRSEAVLETLNKIFPPKGLRHPIVSTDISRTFDIESTTGSSPKTDGIARYRNSIPCILVECRNEAVTSCIPIGELIAYYKLVVDALCLTPVVLDGSRLPTIGITIIGNSITFYALAYVCSIVCLPLTTSLWCLPMESGGSDRYQLYAAFKAASVLLECIDDEAKRLLDGPCAPAPINRPVLPQFKKLRRYHNPNSHTPTSDTDPSEYIQFQFENFLAKDINRHVYMASSLIGPLVVKLTRSYSPDLHAFCAHLGRAPKLCAYEKLRGGIIAVAMEYVEGRILAPSSDPVLQHKWTTAMKDLVEKMHAKDFVHGDLRPPNFMIVKDEIMLLDFDWGGKVGEARYPPVPLHEVLTRGRATLSLDITRQDDERILKDTIEYVHGR